MYCAQGDEDSVQSRPMFANTYNDIILCMQFPFKKQQSLKIQSWKEVIFFICYFIYPHFKVCILHFRSSTFILKWFFETSTYTFTSVCMFTRPIYPNKQMRKIEMVTYSYHAHFYSSTWAALSTLMICVLYAYVTIAKSIAGSPHGDPWLESCKNPAVIRR